MIKDITIRTIPHSEQRYETVGDWFFDDGGLQIRVSDTGSWRSNMAVAVHELIEVLGCQSAGITQEEVDQFDMGHPGLDEPGDDPAAPYHRQHTTASDCERMVVMMLDLEWEAHEENVDKVS